VRGDLDLVVGLEGLVGFVVGVGEEQVGLLGVQDAHAGPFLIGKLLAFESEGQMLLTLVVDGLPIVLVARFLVLEIVDDALVALAVLLHAMPRVRVNWEGAPLRGGGICCLTTWRAKVSAKASPSSGEARPRFFMSFFFSSRICS